MSRLQDLNTFYTILDDLKRRLGRCRLLSNCTGKSGWPVRGVYFFFEDGEARENGQPRVVRVGTHAISSGSRTTLWNRLHTHKGHSDGRGNHRGSIFRKRVGEALLATGPYGENVRRTWGIGSSAPKDVRIGEDGLERTVSTYIGRMPFLWLAVDDLPCATSQRAYIERNCIALLSNFNKPPVDPPSPTWLGLSSPEPTIRLSGLWNTNHVADTYDPTFLEVFARFVPGGTK